MSNLVLIIGESGSGKSTSIRNLNHEETCLISVIDKPLPFKGYKKKYIREAVEGRSINYLSTDNHEKIIRSLQKINTERKEIKTIIIDDFQYLLSNEFMLRAKERGFDKFTEIGQHAHSVIMALMSLRDDLDCFVLSHSNTDETGRVKTKTIGKMLDDKITIEGMFTVVLHSIIVDKSYKFLTQDDGKHLAKSPIDMFDSRVIDNDLQYVKERMYNYFNEDINQ